VSGRGQGRSRDGAGIAALLGALRPRHARLIGAVGKTVAHLYPADPSPRLRAFVDAQLLITAQTDAEHADLAYGATALDLARTGTFHLAGGVAAIATALARAVRRAGGRIAYRRVVERIVVDGGRATGVRLDDGTLLRAPRIVAAIPLANVARLLEPGTRFPVAAGRPAPAWGAFMAYLALPAGVVPDDLPAHHQTVAAYGAPPGEGNTAFLSFSAPGEPGRARGGGRALTMSTHTAVDAWEAAFRAGTYDERKRAYAARLRTALERVVPGAWDAATFVDLATPHTFEAYTGRWRGLVGGVAQTPAVASLGAASHRSGIRGLMLAGDTVFPGQSTVGASLSGAAAARACGARC